MNLRGLVNSVTSNVNPNITVTVKRSTGFTIGVGLKQIPTYADPVVGPAQIQALANSDLKQLEGLNIQGVVKAIYLRGALAGVVRPTGVGGDIVTFDCNVVTDGNGNKIYTGDGDILSLTSTDWLVVKVLEQWSTWTKCVIQLQGGV